MEFPRHTTSSHAVSLTPLIDLVFLLVVFFMLSSSFALKGVMEMQFFPQGESGGAGDNKVVTVRVMGEEKVMLNGQVVTRSAFAQELGRIILAYPERTVVIIPEEKASVQALVSVLDVVNVSGAKQVTITE